MAQQKKGLIARMLEGKEKSEEYARSTLPTNRWQLFWDIFKGNFGIGGCGLEADLPLILGKAPPLELALLQHQLPGGQKQFSPADVAAGYKGYERLIKHVVKGMLPKNRLGVHLLNNLYIFDGPEHTHAAQTPKTIDINSYK